MNFDPHQSDLLLYCRERKDMKGELKSFRTDSQNAKILQYLKTGKSLTVMEALNLGFGANLRSRISNIEKAGYIIKRETIKFTGGYICRYSLKDC